MTSDLSRRLARLEALRPILVPRETAAQAQHAARMAGLTDFVDAAWPGRPRELAHYVALIAGLPSSPALRRVLRGEELEAVARDLYGDRWREKLDATAAEAAETCERAHGPGWWEQFAAIWRGDHSGSTQANL